MPEKTLSTGTLNMRFMQNARRAPPTAPEQPHSAQWELPPDIRQPSDTPCSPSATDLPISVTYETSYLPFLFPSLHDTHGPSSLSPSNTLRPRGRRVFNKRGDEITREPSLKTDPENRDQGASEHTKTSHPQSISSIASLTTRRSKNIARDAKNVVFDMSGVGTDLRQSSSTPSFVRPSGVDAPPDPPKPSDSTRPAKVKRSRTSGEPDKAQKKTRPTPIE